MAHSLARRAALGVSSQSRLLALETSQRSCQTSLETRLLAVSGVREMHSKTSGLMEPLEKPWPYKKIGYNNFFHLIDNTTKRFKDNSKMVVVEGPPAIDKTKFAMELAEEFGMKYVPGTSMEQWYINSYGYDLRELDHAMTWTRNKSFDEKKFAQDPAGQEGGADRMMFNLHLMRYFHYMEGLEHLFNTGQGIVTEKSPHSDWVFIEAAYRQGWISKTTRKYYYTIRDQTICELLRPNLIIYLDAPVDVVQKNIRTRAQTTHPWEKNSPVFENTGYLEHLYDDLFKKQYLPEAGIHSYVLTYDWSEGGDTEVVVEDIDRMGHAMDYHDKYDKQQLDWRLLTEDNFGQKRYNYTAGSGKMKLLHHFNSPHWFADEITLTTTEAQEQDRVRTRLPGSMFQPGYNTELGDKEPFFNFLNGKWGREGGYGDVPYNLENSHNDSELEHGDRVRAKAREAGDVDWWKKGWAAASH